MRLATVHRVKGLEWPHVIVLSATEGLMPHRLAGDLEEERRVFHVALTRCSESVLIVSDGPKSPFLREMSWRSKLEPTGLPRRRAGPPPTPRDHQDHCAVIQGQERLDRRSGGGGRLPAA